MRPEDPFRAADVLAEGLDGLKVEVLLRHHKASVLRRRAKVLHIHLAEVLVLQGTVMHIQPETALRSVFQQFQCQQLAAVHRQPARVPEVIQRPIGRIAQAIAPLPESPGVVIREAELQQVDPEDSHRLQPVEDLMHLRFRIRKDRHFHHHTRKICFGQFHCPVDLLPALRGIFQLQAEADLLNACVTEGRGCLFLQQVSRGIEAHGGFRPECSRSAEVFHRLRLVQQRFAPGQGHILQPRLPAPDLTQLLFPVFLFMGIAVVFFLIRIETEEAVSMAHERDDPGIAVNAPPAGIAGAAHFAQHQTCPFVARLHAAARELFPRTAQFRFPFRCKRQPELLHLADKIVINREAVFRILPERRVPYCGKILVIQQQRHAAPPLHFFFG